MSGEFGITDHNHHPFDDARLSEYLAATFPSYTESLQEAARPTLSDNPDELEQWEANEILARKQPFDYEDMAIYLRRLLYEETFSVNQNPGLDPPKMFRGVPGLTPGGLISHFYPRYVMNQAKLEDIIELPELEQPDLKLAIINAKERDYRAAESLTDMIATIMQPDALTGDWGYESRIARNMLEKGPSQETYDSVAYRLLKMFKAAPEMLQPVQDEQLHAKFVKHGRDVTKAELILRAWQSSQVILPEGYYTHADTPEIQTAVENLLALRTHPEMQVFFKYLSPSGYINASEAELE